MQQCIWQYQPAPTQDHALYRVFDSLSFENEEKNQWETGVTMNGDFSEEQSLELGLLIFKF